MGGGLQRFYLLGFHRLEDDYTDFGEGMRALGFIEKWAYYFVEPGALSVYKF